jgi:hypothetical protein
VPDSEALTPPSQPDVQPSTRNALPVEQGTIRLGLLSGICVIITLLLCMLVLMMSVLILVRLLFAGGAQVLGAQADKVSPVAAPSGSPWTPVIESADDRKHRHVDLKHAPAVPDPGKNTRVVEFADGAPLLEGLSATLVDEWREREEESKAQEESIVEQVIEENIALGMQLAASRC